MKNRILYILINAAIVVVLFAFSPFPNSMAFAGEEITIHFTGMDPHVGQNLYLRLINKATLKEDTRTSLNITMPDFDVTVPVTSGNSYFIDFFADHNGNGLYDPPPTDHAWRMEADNVTNGQEFNFAHNTNFTDIDWEYIVTIHFTGMTPHLGQLLELRVGNDNTGKEVDRTRISSIPAADFDVIIVGIKLNTEYKVEFYADHSGNGLYDPPPTDHAWLITFENLTGDVSLDFSHNTNFEDINWKYLLTVNLAGMVPHIGQLFELRVVKISDMSEVNRVALNQILVPDFSIFLDGIELNHDYNIDFYADHNGNGGYDPPPTDHAWRLTFNSTNGNFVQDFTHNTNFTDIQWPPPLSVEKEDGIFADEYQLLQNYPNPFNPSTKIKFTIPSNVILSEAKNLTTLKVYDVLGNKVTTLINKELPAGEYEFEFQSLVNGHQLPTGVYFYQLRTGSFVQTKKMLLLK